MTSPERDSPAPDPSSGAHSSPKRPILLRRVDRRVDRALAANYLVAHLLIGMAVALFTFGLLLLLLAYRLKNPYVGGGALIVESFLIFPFKEIRRLRRDNLILQIFPAFIACLPEDVAVVEIKALLASLRGEE